ncbi:MAG: cysteine--tRNA ligase [bacterium]
MLKVYNTLTKQKQEFIPIEPKKVMFYHCGPTVYWVQHIGNLRGMICADLIRRSLIYMGYEVKFVRNYTDVGHLTGDNIGDADTGEDRMEKAAKREGLDPDKIANKYIELFNIDLEKLNILQPTYTPRATEFIQQMIDLVQVLLDKGFAYATPKAIYFDVTKKADYNKLNRQNLEENRQGSGTGDVSDPAKKHPFDFALWFFKTGVHSNALQTWESPFSSTEVEKGRGFPGWHIECSAMSSSLLADTIDLHMGGIEHIAIHHTNEIAQSESASGKEFVHYWLHNEHLTVDDQKMSKSLGNVYAVSDIEAKGYDPLALRYFFLQAHYRSKQNFTWEALDAAKQAFSKLKKEVLNWKKAESSSNTAENEVETLKNEFLRALEDDFNIPQALAVVWKTNNFKALSDQEKLNLVLDFDKVLGLKLSEVKENQVEIPEAVKKLLEERQLARVNKDWAKSDQIREQIKKEFGMLVEDSGEGQKIIG